MNPQGRRPCNRVKQREIEPWALCLALLRAKKKIEDGVLCFCFYSEFSPGDDWCMG